MISFCPISYIFIHKKEINVVAIRGLLNDFKPAKFVPNEYRSSRFSVGSLCQLSGEASGDSVAASQDVKAGRACAGGSPLGGFGMHRERSACAVMRPRRSSGSQ